MYMKGVAFSNKRSTQGVPFLKKWYIKGQGVGHRGGASPYENFLSTHPPPPGFHSCRKNDSVVIILCYYVGRKI